MLFSGFPSLDSCRSLKILQCCDLTKGTSGPNDVLGSLGLWVGCVGSPDYVTIRPNHCGASSNPVYKACEHSDIFTQNRHFPGIAFGSLERLSRGPFLRLGLKRSQTLNGAIRVPVQIRVRTVTTLMLDAHHLPIISVMDIYNFFFITYRSHLSRLCIKTQLKMDQNFSPDHLWTNYWVS